MGLQDKIKEINKLLKEGNGLTQDQIEYFKKQSQQLKSNNDSLKSANLLYDNINNSIEKVSDNLDYVSKALRDSVNELKPGNEYLRQQVTSTRKLSNLAAQVLSIRQGEVSTSKKEITNLQQQAKARITNLKAVRDSGKIQGEALNALKSDIEAAGEFEKSLKKVAATADKVNKKLGFAPLALGGIDKAFQKMGLPPLGIDDAIQETNKLMQANDDVNGKLKTSSVFAKQLGKNLKAAASPANLMALTIGQMVKATKKLDKGAGEFSQDLDISYGSSLRIAQNFNRISNLSGDAAFNTDRFMKNTQEINSIMGTNAEINQGDLETFTKLRRQAGLSKEELTGIFKQSLALGGSLEDNVNEFQRSAKIMSIQKGIAINTKTLMKDIGNIASVTKLSLQGGTEALAESMVRAKAVGLELSKMEGIADSLMDFESSITAELEAELLTGKQLNLEKARQLALNNDLAGAAEEIAKQTGSAADFGKMNRIQQESLAKAMGMSRDALGDMLFEQEALSKLNRTLTTEEQRAFNLAKDKLGVEEASRMVKEDQLGELVDQQSLTDQLADQTLHLQEIFVSMAPALTSVMELLSGMLEIVSLILIPFQAVFDIATGIGDSISALFPKLGALGKTMKALASLAIIYGAYTAYSSIAITPFIGPLLGAAAAATVLAVGFGTLSKVNDMMMPGEGSNGYGKRTLTGPEGAIQLNNKDTIIAGTNLFGDDIITNPGESTKMMGKGEVELKPKTQSPPQINMSVTNSKLDAILTAIEKGSIIEMSGAKMGETINQGARAIQ